MPNETGREAAQPTTGEPRTADDVRGALRAGWRASAPHRLASKAIDLTDVERVLGERLAALRRQRAIRFDQLERDIADDFASGSREREVLSAVFNRYFGPRLTVGDLAGLAGVHRRTVQRRLREGYARVAGWWGAEREGR